jgi:putative RNA 2'-phosphotransferase
MKHSRLVKISKYLSKHLRHQPERLGLTLEPGGWVKVDELLGACANAKFPITKKELQAVVATNDKQRFAFDAAGTRIRANQGHSIPVDLQLEPQTPPAKLYHGTGHRAIESILRHGLSKMARHHVHLSTDPEQAKAVGKRHGRPVVLSVDAARMVTDGYSFYYTANGVWLVEAVPPQYLQFQ